MHAVGQSRKRDIEPNQDWPLCAERDWHIIRAHAGEEKIERGEERHLISGFAPEDQHRQRDTDQRIKHRRTREHADKEMGERP